MYGLEVSGFRVKGLEIWWFEVYISSIGFRALGSLNCSGTRRILTAYTLNPQR